MLLCGSDSSPLASGRATRKRAANDCSVPVSPPGDENRTRADTCRLARRGAWRSNFSPLLLKRPLLQSARLKGLDVCDGLPPQPLGRGRRAGTAVSLVRLSINTKPLVFQVWLCSARFKKNPIRISSRFNRHMAANHLILPSIIFWLCSPDLPTKSACALHSSQKRSTTGKSSPCHARSNENLAWS